jgi:hypothetical protein
MSKTKNILKAVELIRQENKLRAKCQQLSERVRKLLGTDSLIYGEHDALNVFRLEIPLKDYLAVWSNAKPEMRTWASHDGSKRASLDYPCQDAGLLKDGTKVYVDARSPSFLVPESKDAPQANGVKETLSIVS